MFSQSSSTVGARRTGPPHPTTHSHTLPGAQASSLGSYTKHALEKNENLDLLPGQQFLLPRLQLSRTLRWSPRSHCPLLQMPHMIPSPAWEDFVSVMRSYSFIGLLITDSHVNQRRLPSMDVT